MHNSSSAPCNTASAPATSRMARSASHAPRVERICTAGTIAFTVAVIVMRCTGRSTGSRPLARQTPRARSGRRSSLYIACTVKRLDAHITSSLIPHTCNTPAKPMNSPTPCNIPTTDIGQRIYHLCLVYSYTFTLPAARLQSRGASESWSLNELPASSEGRYSPSESLSVNIRPNTSLQVSFFDAII